MRIAAAAALGACVLLAAPSFAQFAYPAKGQSPEKQKKDEGAKVDRLLCNAKVYALDDQRDKNGNSHSHVPHSFQPSVAPYARSL